MFVLWNCNEISSNVMWTIRNEADKTFVRTKYIDCLIRNSIRVHGVICSIIDKRLYIDIFAAPPKLNSRGVVFLWSVSKIIDLKVIT